MGGYVIFGFIVAYMWVMEAWLNRKGMTLPRALAWSGVYVYAAACFAVYLWFSRGSDVAQLFGTAWAIEKALSVDNLMVFSAIFSYFGIAPQFRHRVLHWGVVGAILCRLAFTLVGVQILQRWAWAEIWFAGLVLISAFMLLGGGDDRPVEHRKRWYVRLVKKFWPVHTGAQADSHFFVRSLKYHPRRGHDIVPYWCVTPAFLCLVSIEVSDVMFAFDSVPAIIAVARDPFIIYSAMVFAVLGLRCLFFVLDHFQRTLYYLNAAVFIVLLYVAAKLGAHAVWGLEVSPAANLIVIGSVLTAGVGASLLRRGIPNEREA